MNLTFFLFAFPLSASVVIALRYWQFARRRLNGNPTYFYYGALLCAILSCAGFKAGFALTASIWTVNATAGFVLAFLMGQRREKGRKERKGEHQDTYKG
jgi:hypothetical protein